MSVFFTSDTHFWHNNICRYTNRPFDSVEQMNEELIKRWNNKVKPGDQVYHLGDFSFGTPQQALSIKKRLNGQVHLLKGNHEKTTLAIASEFVWVKDYYELNINKQAIVLMHYPLESWNRMGHGAYMFHGHCHFTLAESKGKKIDVGVDNPICAYGPLSYEELQKVMEARIIDAIDHHGNKQLE